jgi:septum site-determining protein MinC
MSLKKSPFFELRSGSVDTLLFIVKTTDLDSVRAELVKRFEATPEFFADDVVAIDVRRLADAERVPLAELEQILTAVRMRPVGVVADAGRQGWVRESGLALLDARDARGASAPEAPVAPTAPAAPLAPTPEAAPTEASDAPQADAAQASLFGDEPPAAAPAEVAEAPAELTAVESAQIEPATGSATVVVDRPLRSGQRIYAKGDLVVLAPVSHGAEVIAEGHIHIYAPLRGRALAGVLGNHDARVFCTSFDPELISIAGIYRTAETPLPDELRGKPVQVRLAQEKLMIEPLRLS